jgi:hypothetical protein
LQVARCDLEASLAGFDSKNAGISIAMDREKPASKSQLAKVMT